MKWGGLILALFAAAALVVLLWRLFQAKKALRREQEENRQLRGLLQTGSQLAQSDRDQLRKLRHDLRHYLDLAQIAPELEQAALPLHQALGDVPSVGGENWAISALEQLYRERAQVLGFQADLRITSPSTGGADMADLYLVVGNLLENGIEALQREGNGHLRARSVSTAGYFSLVVGNTCTRPLRTLNGRYLSSKAPGRFGLGLETVREVARRYGGQAEFSVENGEFRASVFLPRPNREPRSAQRPSPSSAQI